MAEKAGAALSVTLVHCSTAMPASPYEGGKNKRHFTLSDTASDHLSSIAQSAGLSRSEALERLIRSVPEWEGGFSLSNEAWKECIDYTAQDTDHLPDDNTSLDDPS